MNGRYCRFIVDSPNLFRYTMPFWISALKVDRDSIESALD